ncbi:hypothetical protein CHLNCDRAFT_36647 [Chlorella variabilis]|uniref:non-specific serine/threonine protein kinase n=1 Tax=Chlorella variabilis TaxID=554065 RepID=E1ZMB5_CHLVA|nr:hypothetical protein CHLNCDRAFT_36647 [Chlorella variabilis]EFN52977.1 hypothetical protein CHLNCDRAFT_36647 [Chlorella variabilis]|eukprot:XP_005845079.1 hypothetical protein CHLNCDRAFT_36647 [Chlorella variabilis]
MCPGTAALAPASVMSDPEYKAPRMQLSLADFELLRRIGDGSYSHVVLARHRATGRDYALKVIDKQYIMRHRVVDYIRKERQILDALQYDGIAKLYFTFQDAYSLYLGLEYCPNGELYDQIRLQGRLPEATAAAYAGEVVLMLRYLRQQGVVHRDLKPENLLLDGEGHLKLIDFGSAKQLAPEEEQAAHADAPPDAAAKAGGAAAKHAAAQPGSVAAAVVDGAAAGGEDGGTEAGGSDAEQAGGSGEEEPLAEASQSSEEEGEGAGADGEAGPRAEGGSGLGAERSKRAVSLVGTADYVSPEILNNRAVTCAADLWALGCVVYQMLAGRPPFKSPSEYLTFQKIVEADYELPEGGSEAAADLVARLLRVEPAQRIGAADLAELQAHPFFAGIDWDTLRSQPAPEFMPDIDPGEQLVGSWRAAGIPATYW